jgi:hypothetical protein
MPGVRPCCLPHATKHDDQKRFSSNERCENLLPLRRPLVPHFFREARVECKLRHDREFVRLLYVYLAVVD